MTDFENGPLRYERDGGIVRLTLNRPEAGNPVTFELAHALVEAAIRCDTDDSVHCVVLTGSGRFFCVGGDLGLFASAGDGAAAFLSELAGLVHLAVTRLARMLKPLLVLVNGPAAGAGLSLAVLGDVVLAARSSHFTVAYGAVGLTPDGGATWLLPRLVGLRKAQELILTNRRVASDEAEAIGLVTRVVEDADLEADGAKTAERLARAATAAVGAARVLLLESFDASLETQLEREARAISLAGARAESREGIAAFSEKRQPDFQGRV